MIHVGKTRDGGFEFGEFYHVAAYLAADNSHKAAVIGDAKSCQPYVDFLNSVSEQSTIHLADQPPETVSPARTSVYFEAQKDTDLESRVSNILKPLVSNPSSEIKEFAKPFISNAKSCFIWIRGGNFRPERNLTCESYNQLVKTVSNLGYRPIPIGSSTDFIKAGKDNLVEFYSNKLFANDPINQLTLLNYLCENANVHFSMGMKSGGMDGLAFLNGHKTIYFGRTNSDERMSRVRSAFKSFHFVPILYNDKFECFSKSELGCIQREIELLEQTK